MSYNKQKRWYLLEFVEIWYAESFKKFQDEQIFTVSAKFNSQNVRVLAMEGFKDVKRLSLLEAGICHGLRQLKHR